MKKWVSLIIVRCITFIEQVFIHVIICLPLHLLYESLEQAFSSPHSLKLANQTGLREICLLIGVNYILTFVKVYWNIVACYGCS